MFSARCTDLRKRMRIMCDESSMRKRTVVFRMCLITCACAVLMMHMHTQRSVHTNAAQCTYTAQCACVTGIDYQKRSQGSTAFTKLGQLQSPGLKDHADFYIWHLWQCPSLFFTFTTSWQLWGTCTAEALVYMAG